MIIEEWWPQLRPETRQWLVANNGDAVPPPIVDEIAAVGDPAASDAWWAELDGSSGRSMPDGVVAWIEEATNDEVEPFYEDTRGSSQIRV